MQDISPNKSDFSLDIKRPAGLSTIRTCTLSARYRCHWDIRSFVSPVTTHDNNELLMAHLPCSIWTVFPYPISETTELRNDLSSCMFLLSAFYENVHETIKARVSGKAGDASRKGTHAYNLERARQSLFSKLVVVLNNLRTNSEFSQFQLRIGGKFPREEYLA